MKILTHSVPLVKIFDYSWKSLTYFFLHINLMAQSVSGNSLNITNLKKCAGLIVNLKQKWRSIIISSLLLPTFQVGASFADPNNPCISYSCHNTGFVAVVQDCPKQTWCAEVSHNQQDWHLINKIDILW